VKTQEDKVNESKSKSDYLKEKLRRALIDSGYPTSKVDEVLKEEVESLPENLIELYFQVLKEEVKESVRDNADKDSRFKNLNSL